MIRSPDQFLKIPTPGAAVMNVWPVGHKRPAKSFELALPRQSRVGFKNPINLEAYFIAT